MQSQSDKTGRMLFLTEEELFETMIPENHPFRKLNDLIEFEMIIEPLRTPYSDLGQKRKPRITHISGSFGEESELRTPPTRSNGSTPFLKDTDYSETSLPSPMRLRSYPGSPYGTNGIKPLPTERRNSTTPTYRSTRLTGTQGLEQKARPSTGLATKLRNPSICGTDL